MAKKIPLYKKTQSLHKEHLSFEKLISNLSSQFVNLSIKDIDEKINEGLQLVGEFMGVDRCFIDQFSPDKSKFQLTHMWFADGIPRDDVALKVVLSEHLPWYTNRILRGDSLIFENPEEIPEKAENERRYIREAGLKSSAIVPLQVGKAVIGNFGYDMIRRKRRWLETDIRRLWLLSEVFSSALARKKAAIEIELSKQRLASFMENSPPFMYIKDKSGRHLYGNKSILNFSGLNLKEFIGTTAHHFMPEEVAKKIEAFDREVVEKGVKLELGEYNFVRDGILRHFWEIKFPVALYSGETGVGGIVFDITALKLAEKSLTEQLEFERLIADIAARLGQTGPEQMDEMLDWTLSTLGQFLRTERSFLAQFSEDYNSLFFTNTWFADNIEHSSIFETDLASELPSFFQYIRNGKLFIANPGLSGIPDELRIRLEQDGINSGVVVPICVERKSIGMLGLDTVVKAREYPQSLVNRLQMVADMIGITLHRVRAEKMLIKKLKFEDLLSRLSATFINIKAADIDQNIERGLQIIAEILDVERVNLFQFSHNQDILSLTHSFSAKGVKASPKAVFSNQHPWFTKKLVQKESFYFSKPSDLPEEAKAEKEYLKREGIISAFIVPLVAEGTSHGCISLSAMTRERQWPDNLTPQLMLLSEVFSNALMRKQADEKISKNLMEIKQLKNRLEQENIYLRDQMYVQDTHRDIIGTSDAIKYVLYKIKQVAPSDTTALIQGETGTGKELVAVAIHRESTRRKNPFIKVNCAALPANLIESELFGREKGAFTGSIAKQIGRFELADKGTIFLDEVGELPLELQAKLLRIIESGEFERLGSPHTVKVDVRIIASTNRDLLNEIKNGRFREDLYYRLNVFPVTVPPLRERKDDIPVLANFFLSFFRKKFSKEIESIPQEILQNLQDYHWPGNVRELQNIIERAMIISPDSTLQLADKLETFRTEDPAPSRTMSLSDIERNHILQILEQTRWKIEGKNGAAESLRLNPSTLRTRMRKLGIVRRGLRS